MMTPSNERRLQLCKSGYKDANKEMIIIHIEVSKRCSLN